MKQLLLTLGLLAAPLAFPGASSEANMNVPFEFRAGSTNMPAGSYRVRTEQSPGGIYRIFFSNKEGQVVVVPTVRIDAPVTSTQESGFIFHCETETTCQLREMHSANGPSFRLR